MRKIIIIFAVFILGVVVGGGCLYLLIGRGPAMVYSGAAERIADAALKVKLGEQKRFIQEFEKNAPSDIVAVRSLGDYDFVRSALLKYKAYYEISGTSMPKEVAEAMDSLPPAPNVLDKRSQSPTQSSSRIGVGDTVPVTSVLSIDGQEIPLDSGVVVVNFFSTACQPCMLELPSLEQNVWQPFKDKGVTLIGIGRGHSSSELRAFKQNNNYSFPLAADPNEEFYNIFARQYIPQTFLIGKDGSIKHHMVGYILEDFSKLLIAIKKEIEE